ncbi:MAG TPA: hypothetical protein VIX84_18025 [Acidimicrobiales bacterium]
MPPAERNPTGAPHGAVALVEVGARLVHIVTQRSTFLFSNVNAVMLRRVTAEVRRLS